MGSLERVLSGDAIHPVLRKREGSKFETKMTDSIRITIVIFGTVFIGFLFNTPIWPTVLT